MVQEGNFNLIVSPTVSLTSARIVFSKSSYFWKSLSLSATTVALDLGDGVAGALLLFEVPLHALSATMTKQMMISRLRDMGTGAGKRGLPLMKAGQLYYEITLAGKLNRIRLSLAHDVSGEISK